MPVKLQGHRWRTLRAKFTAECCAVSARCWLCGQVIDYTAPPQTTWAFEIDHALPRATHPELAWDPTNLRPSHVACNRRRGSQPIQRWAPANW
jgi:5-methylcytosine-specific restriction endonuclease McrA